MRWAVLFLPLVASALAQPAETPTPTPPIDPKVELKISILGSRHEFHIGEIIPIKLAFSSKLKKRYQLNEAQYDRSGRMEYEHFIVTPTDGVVDPLANYERGMGGGLTGYQFLTRKPWTIELNLNEWVRFTRPGEYKLSVSSERVELPDPSSPMGTSPVTARSNETTLKISAADPAWQKQVFDGAVATLKRRVPVKLEDTETSPAYHALETLRFLGTPEATRELANQLCGESPGRLDFVCYIGLVSSPHPEVAREALQKALADADRPVDDTLLDALSMLESPHIGRWVRPQEKRKTLEELVQILPNKRGKALSISLYTALNEVWTPVDEQLLSKQTTEKLVSQLISAFDQLSAEQKAWLLEQRWEQIKNPELLPLLKQYAKADFSKVGRDVTVWALRRWYELNPVSARPAIIDEIVRPHPRFSSRELGFLPDATLPEADKPLAEHLGTEEFDQPSNVALLIARYATAAITPDVIRQLDPHIGKAACDFQNPLLAYLFRVDPKLARPRIERAIAARGKGFTACNHGVLQEVSEIHYDPSLEDIAIRALDDPDPEVGSDAANVLRQFGSPKVEPVLWQKYEKWNTQWQVRESELDLAVVGGGNERLNDLQFGRNLLQALATANAWLADEKKLERLVDITKVRIVRHELDNLIRRWRQQPLSIIVYSCVEHFDVGVVQYHLQSINALKDKLKQFPRGTRFGLPTRSDNRLVSQLCLSEIRDFLITHQMQVTAEDQSNGR